jgi:hypothetical protein
MDVIMPYKFIYPPQSHQVKEYLGNDIVFNICPDQGDDKCWLWPSDILWSIKQEWVYAELDDTYFLSYQEDQ